MASHHLLQNNFNSIIIEHPNTLWFNKIEKYVVVNIDESEESSDKAEAEKRAGSETVMVMGSINRPILESVSK